MDYYLDPDEPPGRWWGRGLGAVGLSGEVAGEDLQSLLDGRHPQNGGVLGRRFGDSSAGGSMPRSRRPSRSRPIPRLRAPTVRRSATRSSVCVKRRPLEPLRPRRRGRSETTSSGHQATPQRSLGSVLPRPLGPGTGQAPPNPHRRRPLADRGEERTEPRRLRRPPPPTEPVLEVGRRMARHRRPPQTQDPGRLRDHAASPRPARLRRADRRVHPTRRHPTVHRRQGRQRRSPRHRPRCPQGAPTRARHRPVRRRHPCQPLRRGPSTGFPQSRHGVPLRGTDRGTAATIDQRYATLTRLAAYTGLRAGEIGALRIGRVDLDHHRLTIAESVTEVQGLGLVFGEPKTYERRSVTLPPFRRDDLAHHLHGRAADPDAFVFPSPDGTVLNHKNFYRRAFKPAVRRAGLPERTRFHDLRHTCAALCIALGAHPKAIQERLGHSSITVTLDRYGHLFPKLDETLTSRLDHMRQTAVDLSGVSAISCRPMPPSPTA